MKNPYIRLLVIILTIGGMIAFMAYSQSHPPEKAKITGLRIGYYSTAGGWVYSTSIPVQTRKLQICGAMARLKPTSILFRISTPNDINEFLGLDESFFELKPGDFCVNLQLVGEVVPGDYILWIMDGRRSVAQLAIEFKGK